ncbi:MAG TPA: flagellar operon protein YvyF [Clostridiaceae bacterium]|nr:flagellar operon protein YvyF [Clostridiaceae bacterium]
MPEVMNCRRCRKIFMYSGTGPKICESCKKLEEEEFEKVRAFVREFPGATAQEVSRETGVPTQLIYRFLKEGRLEVSESSPIALQCENCGVRIKSGRFCVQCSKKLATDMIRMGRTLSETVQKSSEQLTKETAGLRYLHGERKETKEK